jgi:hypothetical protein
VVEKTEPTKVRLFEKVTNGLLLADVALFVVAVVTGNGLAWMVALLAGGPVGSELCKRLNGLQQGKKAGE